MVPESFQRCIKKTPLSDKINFGSPTKFKSPGGTFMSSDANSLAHTMYSANKNSEKCKESLRILNLSGKKKACQPKQ